jgi:hypothetical protein
MKTALTMPEGLHNDVAIHGLGISS